MGVFFSPINVAHYLLLVHVGTSPCYAFVSATISVSNSSNGSRLAWVSVLCTVQLNRINRKHTAISDVCLFIFVSGAIIKS